MASSFGSLRNKYPMNLRANIPFVKSYYEATPGIARDLARISSIFVSCRERVQAREDLKKIDQGFLFGAFTAADAMYAPVCFRIKLMSLPIEDPVAKKYIETLCSCAIVQEWVKEAAKETQVCPSDEIQFPSE
jgi:glutathione S-transferase